MLYADVRDLSHRDAGDIDVVACGQTGHIAQLRVNGVAAAEKRDVPDLDGQSRQQDETHQREQSELEGRFREVPQHSHDKPPRTCVMTPPRLVDVD